MKRLDVAAAGVVAIASLAAGDVVTSTDILRIRFTVSPPYSLTPDMLVLNFGTITVLQPYTTRVAEVYDGATLLGTATKASFGSYTGLLSMNPANSWRHPGSPWDFDTPGTFDFTTIRDGTIQGRIDWHPATGSVDIPLAQVNVQLGQAVSAGSYFIITPAPTVSSITIVRPPCPADYDHNGQIEPADVALFVATWFNSLVQGTLAADFDGNGVVEPADVSLFVGRWFAALGGNCGP